jgi:hypothetical protein
MVAVIGCGLLPAHLGALVLLVEKIATHQHPRQMMTRDTQKDILQFDDAKHEQRPRISYLRST